MIEFMATEEQIKQVMAAAVNAFTPAGLGHLHYDSSRQFNPDDFTVDGELISLDYVQGRMVKLHIKFQGDGRYQIYADKPNKEYQSWAARYLTYEDLLSVAGITVKEQ